MAKAKVTHVFDEIVRSTEKATLYKCGDRNIWLPHSLCTELMSSSDGAIEVEMPEWLAVEKELE